MLKLDKPITRVRYELEQVGGKPLAEIIEPIVRKVGSPVVAGR